MPGFSLCVGGSVTHTSSGHTYFGPSIGFGSEGVSSSSRNGYLLPSEDVDTFVSGWSVNLEGCGSAGVVGKTYCGDVVWGNPGIHRPSLNEMGAELGQGFGSPGGSLSAGYSFDRDSALKTFVFNSNPPVPAPSKPGSTFVGIANYLNGAITIPIVSWFADK